VPRDKPQDLVVRLPVLDRLLDDDPDTSREAPRSPHQALRLVIEAVRRDLQDLLNCRQVWIDEELSKLEEVSHSIAAFGLSDFTAENLTTSDSRKRLQREIETAIKTFEPRLVRVRVIPEPMQPYERHVRFRIDAMLRVDPIQEPVSFDTVLASGGETKVVAV